MKHDLFEERLRSLEYFSSWRLLPGTWVVIRLDGRNFSKLTQKHFEKPFDEKFHQLMIQTTCSLLEDIQGIYAYTESDEISVLLDSAWQFFDRRLEKTVSLSASIASSTFTHACGTPCQFDSRVWLGAQRTQVLDYFRWRQAESMRCSLQSWCYWTLRKNGYNARNASNSLERMSFEEKYELLQRYGVHFKEIPLWQRLGSALYWETYSKEGFNPKSQKQVVVSRRRIKIDRQLPTQEAYEQLIESIIGTPNAQGHNDSSHISG